MSPARDTLLSVLLGAIALGCGGDSPTSAEPAAVITFRSTGAAVGLQYRVSVAEFVTDR